MTWIGGAYVWLTSLIVCWLFISANEMSSVVREMTKPDFNFDLIFVQARFTSRSTTVVKLFLLLQLIDIVVFGIRPRYETKEDTAEWRLWRLPLSPPLVPQLKFNRIKTYARQCCDGRPGRTPLAFEKNQSTRIVNDHWYRFYWYLNDLANVSCRDGLVFDALVRDWTNIAMICDLNSNQLPFIGDLVLLVRFTFLWCT